MSLRGVLDVYRLLFTVYCTLVYVLAFGPFGIQLLIHNMVSAHRLALPFRRP